MFRTILVALDTSEHAAKTAKMACDLAHRYGAKLLILHIVAPVFEGRARYELGKLAQIEHMERTEYEILQQAGRDLMRPFEAAARQQGVADVEVIAEIGDPASIIVSVARISGADLIVLGRRGAGGLPGLLQGSVSQKVIQLADAPCLVVS